MTLHCKILPCGNTRPSCGWGFVDESEADTGAAATEAVPRSPFPRRAVADTAAQRRTCRHEPPGTMCRTPVPQKNVREARGRREDMRGGGGETKETVIASLGGADGFPTRPLRKRRPARPRRSGRTLSPWKRFGKSGRTPAKISGPKV